jgi:ERCC4 domain
MEKTKNMEIVFDSREDLSLCSIPTLTPHLQQMTLPLGDIWFRHKESGEIFTMIERKSYADFLASLKDGRWENQKIRYYQWQQEKPTVRQVIYYLIAPEPIKSFNRFSQRVGQHETKAWESAQLHLMMRDGFHVVVGKTMHDWFQWVESYRVWSEKHMTDMKSYRFLQPEREDAYNTKLNVQITKTQAGNIKKRSDSNTPETCFLTQLCCFPGVSTTIAKGIQTTYPTMRHFLQAMEIYSTMEERIKELKDCMCGHRKLGSVLAKRILYYMYHLTLEEEEQILEDMLEADTPVEEPIALTETCASQTEAKENPKPKKKTVSRKK